MYPENKSTRRRFAGSYFLSLMSITLVLFVLGMYAFLVVYTDKLLDHVRENIGFEVVIKNNVKESSIISLRDEIKKKDYVKSVEYISKEEATKRLEDGTLVSPPLEDLAPFLPKEELERNMFIPLVEE